MRFTIMNLVVMFAVSKAEDIAQKIAGVLKVLAVIPAFLLPKKLRGWRTVVVNFLVAVGGLITSFNLAGIGEELCEFLAVFNVSCSPDPIAGIGVAALAVVNILLRAVTDTPLGEAEGNGDGGG